MKKSKNYKDFERIHESAGTPNKRELNDFEKLLKEIIKAPKPSKEDLKKIKEKKK